MAIAPKAPGKVQAGCAVPSSKAPVSDRGFLVEVAFSDVHEGAVKQ